MKKWLRLKIIVFCVTFIWSIHTLLANTAPQVVSQQEIQNAIQKYGSFAGKRLQAWQQLVNDNIDQPESVQLTNVNNFFNEVRFIDDIDHWKQKDYWATPIEMLSTDAGDCEDYTIAKYFTLKALGVSEKKLYLTYVKAIRLNQAHMVLTYFETPQSIPLVLDNINNPIDNHLVTTFEMVFDDLDISTDNLQVVFGEADAKHWIKQMEILLDSSKSPQIIVVKGMEATLELYMIAQKIGASVPRDIMIIGVGSDCSLRNLTSGISMLKIPAFEMGQEAAKLLLLQLNGEELLKSTIITSADFILKQSAIQIGNRN